MLTPMKPSTMTVMILAVFLPVCAGQSAFPMGAHRLVIETPGGDLPFRLHLEGDGAGGLLAFVVNGSESIRVPEVIAKEKIILRFPHYDSEIVLDVDDAAPRLSGHWVKRRGRGKTTRMRVISKPSRTRFPISAESEGPGREAFAGRWKVAFAKSDDPAVGQFGNDPLHPTACRGTFLTTLGDYRYLSGNAHGGVMHLSCFDGAHAFLFRAGLQADGSLKGDFWSSDSWHETWTATRDDKAALPDGWKLTSWKQDADLSRVRVRDLEGRVRTLDDPAWRGHPRLIEVFGSWCPNCHDHGAYMAELHRRYEDKGLKIVGLAFEHDEDFARSARQVETFMKRHDAHFPVLIAGLSDKTKATASLGILDRVRSFPTTIFIDAKGRLRGIYQGWSGPATGDAHKRLRSRFEELIEAMISER